jgi:hypothetical protein
VNSGGHFAPGASIGTFTAGGLTLQPGAVLDFEITKIGSFAFNDKINVTQPGGLTLNGGTLNLTDAGSVDEGVFTLIDYAGVLNGSVDNLILGATPEGGFTYDLVDTGSVINLIVSYGLSGDFNSDGSVDMADYVVWRKGLGTTYTQDDYDIWLANLGATSGSGSGGDSFGAVPEPTSLVLLAIVGGMLPLLGARRLRSRQS